MAMNNFAFLLADTGGDLDRALAMAQRARQMQPNAIEVADTLGWVYLKKGMLNQATEIFRDLLEKDPARSAYHYHLAVAYHLKGDRGGRARAGAGGRGQASARRGRQADPGADRATRRREITPSYFARFLDFVCSTIGVPLNPNFFRI